MPRETVRLDSLSSAVTRIGTAADPRESYEFCERTVLDPRQADILFNNYDLAYLICSIVPEEALSESWQLTSEDTELAEKVSDRMEELRTLEQVMDAAVMSRVHGDCFLYTAVDDGLKEDQPLEFERVRTVRFIRKVERLKLSPLTWYEDVSNPKFGEVETYTVTAPRGGGSGIVHETRLIPFWGARTSDEKRRTNNGWHLSVLQRVYETLRDLGIAWSSTTLLLSQSTQGKYKVKDLAALLAAPGPEGREALSKRIEMVDYGRSALNSLILDADAEDFDYAVAPLTSLPELLDRFSNRLSAAAGGIPTTKLFGISPAGMNATGEGDAKSWYKILAAYRRDHLNDAVLRIRDLLLAEAKQLDADVNVSWLELDRPSALEEAQRRSAIATADAVYIDRNVLPAEVVAESRFVQENGFDHEIHMDEVPEPVEPEPIQNVDTVPESEDVPAEPDPDPEENLTEDSFNESDHPRASNGEFGSGGGGKKTSEGKKYGPGSDARKQLAHVLSGGGDETHAKPSKAPRAKKEPKPNNAAETKHPHETSTKHEVPVSKDKPDVSKLQKIGEGSARTVYADGNTVVKVAKDKAARADNKQEVEISSKSELFAKITEHAADNSWIRQEKLSPVTSEKIGDSFGVAKVAQKATYDIPMVDRHGFASGTIKGDWLKAATYAAAGNEPAKGLHPTVHKYVAALKQLKADIPKLDLADFGSAHQWGSDASGKVKIADYSFNEERGKK